MVAEEGLVREFKAGEALVKIYRDRQSMVEQLLEQLEKKWRNSFPKKAGCRWSLHPLLHKKNS
mgnify:CR=1 FL=1